jgi:hypothetical protein
MHNYAKVISTVEAYLNQQETTHGLRTIQTIE